MGVILTPHGFKLEPSPFPVFLLIRDAGPSPRMGLLLLFPQIVPPFPASSEPVPHPGPRAGHLLPCPVLASPPLSPLSGPAVSFLVRPYDIHLAARTLGQTASCCLRLCPPGQGIFGTGDSHTIPKPPRTLGTAHWTPGRLCGGQCSHQVKKSSSFSWKLPRKMEEALLPIRAEAWIQINPCSTIHWLHDHKQTLNLLTP